MELRRIIVRETAVGKDSGHGLRDPAYGLLANALRATAGANGVDL